MLWPGWAFIIEEASYQIPNRNNRGNADVRLVSSGAINIPKATLLLPSTIKILEIVPSHNKLVRDIYLLIYVIFKTVMVHAKVKTPEV